MAYVAVQRKTDKDVEHFKYIKRYKKNGKWVYIYDDEDLREYEEGATTTTSERASDGSIEQTVTRKSIDKGSKKSSRSVTNMRTDYSGGKVSKTTYTVEDKMGSREYAAKRTIANAEKYVYDKVLSSNSVARKSISNARTQINSGIDYVKSLRRR